MNQPSRSVTALFREYLHRQIAAQTEGLGFADQDGQAVPHEAVTVQPVDPRLAWEDGLAVLRCGKYGPTLIPTPRLETPPEWPLLVAEQEPVTAVAFCIGNFPQMVRNLQPLLSSGDLTDVHSRAVQSSERKHRGVLPPSLTQWANGVQGYPHFLLVVGVLRLARHFDEASEFLKSDGKVPRHWRALRANEEAALAWQRGSSAEALSSWQAQKPSVPVLFNRGMAALFLGRPADARSALEQAVAQLPDTSSWHHLGHLYLALAAARS
jgi:hypothetical protein